jgi:quinol monooxygenase YgiN
MSFTMLATFVPRPGAEAALLDELTAMVAPSSAEPGCLEYLPLTDPARPGTVVMVEEWADRQALDEHFASAHFARVAPRLADLLGEPVEIIELQPGDGGVPTRVAPAEFRALGSSA